MIAFPPNCIKASGYGRTAWEAIQTLPNETPVDDLLRPERWSNCVRSLKIYDEITVIPQGGPYKATLIVMAVGSNFVKLRLLNVVLLNEAAAAKGKADPLPAGAPVAVKWNISLRKYSIYRTSNGEKIHDGFAIKAEAEAWAADHAAAMAA